MKKTLIALLALAGVAMAAVPSTSVITFDTGGEKAGSYAYGVDWGTESYDAHAVSSPTFTTSDNVIITFNTSNGDKGIYTSYTSYINPSEPTTVWSNQLALDEMNDTLGTSLTLANIDSAPQAYAGGGSSKPILTLNYANVYTVADPCTIYLLVASTKNAVSQLTVTGLADGYTMEYATATGSGYVSDATFSEDPRVSTLIKISGELESTDALVSIASNAVNSGFAMVAYKLIPEPATATLSLLALAGLAARRRRK